ncbi:pollen-specific leucine-rich repeat extensin-like protein 2 isoform X2 [Magnolia sinica]|uniref:pollen-specific leucine-rich repeat extensin-like protein 2 isoform X2 n=1 Tax=Magnolia sinica TaxID=86752 RepID=UPI00265915A9|nr:pollen-specific leucine-rich repeat extensin-like protein 2 isoform X2 [Magnolia sinica]
MRWWRRRWGGCLSVYWCFGSQRHGKRIGHAVLVPEPSLSGPDAPASENPSHPPALVLPFIAPPSSPVSFLQSEPPSATQSPAGLISFTSFSANSYSPGGPNSIFAIGPYAHETQLVSPPVFSTFTTEPSTAPLTPPPEPVHLTTPSSPEVPFAKLLSSSLDHNHKSVETCRPFTSSHYEFQSYQLYPGSPVGHLISPSSVISGSGTSSPFPDLEFPPGGCSFPSFHPTEPPKLLSIDELSARKLVARKDQGPAVTDTPGPTSQDGLHLESQISAIASLANSDNESQNDELLSHRVSFELAAEEMASCAGKEAAILDRAALESQSDPTATVTKEEHLSSEELKNAREVHCPAETSNRSLEKASEDGEQLQQDRAQQPQPSLAAAVSREFKFDNADGASTGPTVSSDWWANERVVGAEAIGPRNNWAFFPIIQPGVS